MGLGWRLGDGEDGGVNVDVGAHEVDSSWEKVADLVVDGGAAEAGVVEGGAPHLRGGGLAASSTPRILEEPATADGDSSGDFVGEGLIRGAE
jgi:hypothetical protein